MKEGGRKGKEEEKGEGTRRLKGRRKGGGNEKVERERGRRRGGQEDEVEEVGRIYYPYPAGWYISRVLPLN
jgi:hypothetical protein